jgi:hypothetical protein
MVINGFSLNPASTNLVPLTMHNPAPLYFQPPLLLQFHIFLAAFFSLFIKILPHYH